MSDQIANLFYCELLQALDALPVKELGQGSLFGGAPAQEVGEIEEDNGGLCCALGAIYRRRLIKASANSFSAELIVRQELTMSVTDENDSSGTAEETPAQRFQRMRAWTLKKIEECR